MGTVNASDVDSVGSLQSWQIVTDSSAGGFSINATTGEITTVNSFNFEAASSYTLVVRVNDGANWSANQTVIIHVLDVNEAPVAAADSFTIRTDQIVSVSTTGLVGNDFDVDGDTLFPVLVTGAANGTVTIGVNGQLTYTPRPGFFGTDTFQYVASDGQLTGNVVTVTIEVQVAASGNTGVAALVRLDPTRITIRIIIQVKTPTRIKATVIRIHRIHHRVPPTSQAHLNRNRIQTTTWEAQSIHSKAVC